VSTDRGSLQKIFSERHVAQVARVSELDRRVQLLRALEQVLAERVVEIIRVGAYGDVGRKGLVQKARAICNPELPRELPCHVDEVRSVLDADERCFARESRGYAKFPGSRTDVEHRSRADFIEPPRRDHRGRKRRPIHGRDGSGGAREKAVE
jgi:hypothetical protein